jgi:predicted transcriptional regulator
MLFGKTASVRIDKDILERLKHVADIAGYATVEEFVTHVLERELSQFEGTDGDDAIREKLRGLGYIS